MKYEMEFHCHHPEMKLQQLSGRICVESLSSLCSIREVIYQVTIINGTLMDDGP